MPQNEPTAEFNANFSEPGAEARPWAEVDDVLTTCEMVWLSTVRADGRPHATPLLAVWDDGALHFCTGAHEQKTKNLQANPHCVVTVGANQYHSGLDVVIEGTAARVTDQERLQRLAALWKSRLDWDFKVGEDGFTDPDGRTGLVYGVRPDKVLAFGKGPFSQTRYRFPAR